MLTEPQKRSTRLEGGSIGRCAGSQVRYRLQHLVTGADGQTTAEPKDGSAYRFFDTWLDKRLTHMAAVLADRDWLAGTPHHKHVAARIEPA